jgi:hypothetical protein
MSEITFDQHPFLLSDITHTFVYYIYSPSVFYIVPHILVCLQSCAEIVNVFQISATYCSEHHKTVFSFMYDTYITELSQIVSDRLI